MRQRLSAPTTVPSRHGLIRSLPQRHKYVTRLFRPAVDEKSDCEKLSAPPSYVTNIFFCAAAPWSFCMEHRLMHACSVNACTAVNQKRRYLTPSSVAGSIEGKVFQVPALLSVKGNGQVALAWRGAHVCRQGISGATKFCPQNLLNKNRQSQRRNCRAIKT